MEFCFDIFSPPMSSVVSQRIQFCFALGTKILILTVALQTSHQIFQKGVLQSLIKDLYFVILNITYFTDFNPSS